MFVGAVPKQAVEQITRVVPFGEWGEVFVGCSGSFRFDRAVKARHPGVKVHSNDVSLLSCSLGALATGASFALSFKDRLAFVEEFLAAQPAGGQLDANWHMFEARVAAVQVALEMAKYKGKTTFARTYFDHYRVKFAEFHQAALIRLRAWRQGLELASFFAGDFREQAARAKAAGGGVAAFPPTYRGGYERLYRFVDENTDWARPSYDVWEPARLEAWVDELDAMGVRYCVLTDHELERHQPVTVWRSQINKPVFTFADRAKSSVRAAAHRSEPFKYRPADPEKLGPATKVEIITANSAQMNFLKDIYLAKGIAHTSGVANYLVLLDGALAGGFIFTREKFGGEGRIYLLCDFALAPKSRVSKLIAMLATSSTVIERLEVKLSRRITSVHTTAFTDKPVSMKYRGIFDLVSRKPGMLNYASPVRRQSPADIYAEWFRRFAANPRHQGTAEGSEAA